METWKEVPGWEQYLASSKGRIAKVLKPEITKNGYSRVTFNDGKRRERKLLHRVVAEVFIPNPHKKPQVNHKNAQKDCNEAGNLEWCTRSENENHKIRMGLMKGERNAYHRLTEDQVRYIRSSGKSIRQLARELGCSRPCISHVRSRRTWRHI